MTSRLLAAVLLAAALAGCEKHSVSGDRPVSASPGRDAATTATTSAAPAETPANTPAPVDADAGTAHGDPATTSSP